MADDFEMRFRLQQVAAYRDLCRRVRRSGRENIFFAGIMLFLAYIVWQGRPNNIVLVLYLILALGELLVGVFKWIAPSAEGVLLDGIVLLVFAAYNFGMQYVRFQNGMPFSPIAVFLGLFMLFGAIGRFKDYKVLRQLFAERPRPEHMAWFDDLLREIRSSDPESDELALDLPTQPHWKAKLLGKAVFFVTLRNEIVLVAAPGDFELLREKVDHGTGRRKSILSIHGMRYPEFQIADASWANYQRWCAGNPIDSSTSLPGSGADHS